MKRSGKITAFLLAVLLCVPFFCTPVSGASSTGIIIGGNAGNAVTIPASGTIGAVLTTGQGSVNKDMPAADHIAKANAGAGTLTASVNGAFFDSYYDPGKTLRYPDNCAKITGMLMSGGEVICRGSGKNVLLGITDDGRYLIDRVNVSVGVRFRGTDKFTSWAVNAYNTDASAVNLITPEMGYGFALQSGAVAVRIQGNTVTDVQTGLTWLDVPVQGEKVLVCNSASWANAAKWGIEPQVGNTAEVVTVLSPEKAGTQEAWDRVVTAVACVPWLLEGGADVFSENTNLASNLGRDVQGLQRTFAAILPDGSLMIGECKASFGQIIDYLKSFQFSTSIHC